MEATNENEAYISGNPFLAIMVMATLLLFSGVIFAEGPPAGGENSAWVKIATGEKQTGLNVGDVLSDAKIIDGKCSMPDIKIGISSSVVARNSAKSIRVGVDNNA